MFTVKKKSIRLASMKLIVPIVFWLSLFFAQAAVAQQTLMLTRPTIVILVDSPAEIARNKNNDEYNEATGDFAVYAYRMVEALKQQRGFRIKWSSAASIRFAERKLKTVLRQKLGGWGYVFYRPGEDPVVIEGVTVDDQLVCIAAKLYGIKVKGYSCGG